MGSKWPVSDSEPHPHCLFLGGWGSSAASFVGDFTSGGPGSSSIVLWVVSVSCDVHSLACNPTLPGCGEPEGVQGGLTALGPQAWLWLPGFYGNMGAQGEGPPSCLMSRVWEH